MNLLITIVLYAMWGVGGILLLAYPAVLVANVMSLAGTPSREKPTLRKWFSVLPFRILMIATTLYPVLYFTCINFSKDAYSVGQIREALLWASPSLIVAIIVWWIISGRKLFK